MERNINDPEKGVKRDGEEVKLAYISELSVDKYEPVGKRSIHKGLDRRKILKNISLRVDGLQGAVL